MDAALLARHNCAAPLVEHLRSASPQEAACLQQDVQACSLEYVERVYQVSMEAAAGMAQGVEPYTDVHQLAGGSEQERQQWHQHGLSLIAQGKVAVLVLAGGQGTRLGCPLPKGCFSVGLPSGKSLFQIQAERIRRLQQLAAAHAPQLQRAGGPARVRWLIMTSPFTHEDTLTHFRDHAFFGLEPSQVTFFQQGWLPCLTEEGQLILDTPSSLAKAPDGNGGVFRALQQAGVLDKLAAEGVECVDCYCVDNILARVGDPLFVGLCHSKGAEVGARVVARAHAQEKVGVFASRGGALSVVEYSELTPEQASAVDPATGELQYKWSNICMHYFSVPWLQKVHAYLAQGTPYHIARKQIPSKDGPVKGIKLELFIFDPFPTATRAVLMEVARAEQFAPVKNASGAASDTPEAARDAVLALGAKWMREARGACALAEGEAGVEVSPLASYAGEGLAAD